MKKNILVITALGLVLATGGSMPAFAAETDLQTAESAGTEATSADVSIEGVSTDEYTAGDTQIGEEEAAEDEEAADSAATGQTEDASAEDTSIEAASVEEYNAWQYSGGKWQYVKSGKVLTGWQQLKWSGGTSWFYFDGSGNMKTGWQYLGWSGGKNWFYFDGNGAMKTGWQQLKWSGGRNWFYFNGNGAMKTGWQYLSWSGGKNWFYFNGNGAMLTGWQQLKWSGGTNYFYFDSNGAMAVNTTVDGYKVDGNGARTGDGSSSASTSTTTTSNNGWVKNSGSWYYYRNGKALTGWQYLNWSGGKNWFYFDGKGVMKTGWQYLSWSGGKNWFYFNGNGAMLTGWQQLKWSGGTNYFYFNSNGAMAVNTTVDGYKVDGNGVRTEKASSTTTSSNNGWVKNAGSWYYYRNGKAVTGWQYLSWSSGKNWFYFNGNGAMMTGWQQLSWSGGTSWFYFNPSNGAMAVNTTVDGFKLDANGAHAITQTAGYPIIPDISHWVPVADWDWVKNNCAFVISKATQGTNYVDPTLESFIKECEARGIPYWLYCYLNSGDELAQAQFMVKTCSGLVGDHFVGYILDVEAGNGASGVSAALNYIKTQSSKTMIYIGRSYYRQSAFKTLIDSRGDNCAWWEARYGKNDGNYPNTSQYSIDSGVDLHQYTSQGKLEGFSRSVDLSRIVGGKSLQWYTTK